MDDVIAINQVTVKSFAEKHEIDNNMANNVLQFLAKKGFATVSTAPKADGQRGKPANLFALPEKVEITL